MRKATKLPFKVGKEISAEKLEHEHVTKVYDNIACQWSGTRYKAWPKVEEFIKKQRPGTLFGDFGAGNGKNMDACNSVGFAFGTDISSNLVRVARENSFANGLRASFEVGVADILDIPVRSEIFDAVICIAVLHHLSTVDRRVRAISECVRCLKPGGHALFYAWAQEQSPDNLNGVKRDSEGEVKTVGTAISGHEFNDQDVFVPWHAKGNLPETVDHARFDEQKKAMVLQRYCHVYAQDEWKSLFSSVNSIVLKDVYWDSGNWAAIIEKV